MKKCFLFISAIILLAACKTTQQTEPLIQPEARASLEFDSIEASSLDQYTLHYRLKTGNPRKQDMAVEIKDWKASLNGAELSPAAASLAFESRAASGARFILMPASTTEKELALAVSLKDLPQDGDTCLAGLSMSLNCSYDGVSFLLGLAADAEFPRIREPSLDIVSIAIVQADLVNTKFKANVRIDNPNMFAVNVLSLGYNLYGAGTLWSSGKDECLLEIPARSSRETDFHFTMNFINMKRGLLDDIIAMRQVLYHFSGEAEVETGIEWLPSFQMAFERSGKSEVVK
ncbi:MAG: LEA type 2 family protein [Treponema sp.]|jgi:LEA14-like dessication related protein|nr:LEA type 2 family protein [Treponema sp.]